MNNKYTAGYKSLISYKLAQIAFDLTWEFVPQYYYRFEDNRQRDQMKQAMRSTKQNIVEGSSERSLSSKLKLYDVAKSSLNEILEDFEDILRLEKISRWMKNDMRLTKLHQIIEGYPVSVPSYPSVPSSNPPPFPSVSLVLGTRRTRGTRWARDEVEIIVNYLIDVLTRCGYLLDKQINAVEEKHRTKGGYRENLLKKRLDYKYTEKR
ncbi:hypothetical protein CO083_03200 [Candidatus Roizmanbacteria bacterium CG_4_9_14_0_8_um_filter_34_12]|uniref:Four helix bundle protein n=1 Tax=Candidatus Roizmanbacteria bacterium CG_4_9_14_0_8_um_filter_34_12 TaxID=1974840 RepID=A0A2M8DCM7_9BACT|nr:MAG: hypothetical protein CO083_03200 [Candidatus Roizmanbacteria bacterium CG_4_9_14_0_8_um_filter_34_12]